MTTAENQESSKRQLQLVQIHLLDEFAAICKKHNLTYWIDFGTLLGAVRHGGFIPWDDDIDVSMPIPDYEKFLTIAEEALPKDIFLQTEKTDPAYKQCFAKLRDNNSTFLEHHENEVHQKENPYHHGIYIDIFPSYEYPLLPKIVRKILLRFTLRSRYAAYVNRHNRFINIPIYWTMKLIWLLLSPFKSGAVGQTPEDNGYNYAVPKKYIFPLSTVLFEGKAYAAPHNTDAYLTEMYGDYMTPPPPEKRIAHACTVLPDTPCDHPRAFRK